MMRRTKIICTLGPATDDKEVLKDMMRAGMNVARMNFSHGSHEEHKQRMDMVKACRKELDLPIGILLDTKGPEIRTKTYKNGKIEIQDGQTFTLTTRDVEGDESIVSISYTGLPQDVVPGTKILIDDGLIAFEVQEIRNGTDIVCKALNGGPLSNRKSINVPGIKLNMPFVSDKDRADIIFGLEQGIDFIAASFTRNADDIMQIRHRAFFQAMHRHGLKADPSYSGCSYYLSECMEKHLPRFLGMGMTAVICCQDTFASAAITQCRQLGYQVPRDISIIGFDDIPICPYTSPPLTTVRQDRIELGKSGYYALNSLMNGVSIGTVLLHADLIVRESTKQPAAGN